MSVRLHCDGCDDELEVGEGRELGIVSKGLYCPDCEAVVLHYVDQRDALHDEVASRWLSGIEELRSEFLERYPEMRLPDE